MTFLREAALRTGLSEAEFAVALVRQYHSLVPEALRRIELPDPNLAPNADAYLRQVDKLRKRVERYCDGGLHLPAELEEAWVSALPQPFGLRCARALVRRMGFLGVVANGDTIEPGEDMASVARISSATGQALEDIAAMLADGSFGPQDIATAPRALERLHDLAASCAGLVERIRRKTGYEGRPATQWRDDDDGRRRQGE